MSGSSKIGRVVAIAQARMGSTRVPGKVMRSLDGKPVLRWTIDALRAASGIDEIVLATSALPADDVIENYCDSAKIICFRGSETDVLDRFYRCAGLLAADIVVRVTCDCPFLDPTVISEVIKLREMTNAEYASNVDPPSWPDGLDVECFTFRALELAHKEATRHSDRDCVTQFISRNRHRFPAANLRCPLPGLEKERWVLDTEKDWEFCKILANHDIGPSYLDTLNYLDRSPEVRKINAGAPRNERLFDALAQEQLPPRTFERSQRIFQRAIQTIPFGAQTFSKSHLQFPAGKSPLYVTHGDGARVFDVDGNDYVDLVSALLPVVLGYRDPDVDFAIRRQLDMGISFSVATELEIELSETLCRLIPCAEMVKFGKSGTDVTTAAVRLARAYTGRDHVLVGGYHGWADWSIGCSDRSLGVPADVKALSHRITFGDINDTLTYFDRQTIKIKGQESYAKMLEIETQLKKNWVAAVIVEPNDDPEYLKRLRSACDYYGAVLIFDEIITGFRYDMGGAQRLYGVTPDLATFGKSMANGMPISALVGRRDIMKKMEPPDNIFYSGTFFGETLSIAAAIATIKKMEECNVIDHLLKTGIRLEFELMNLLERHGLGDFIKIEGYYPRMYFNFKPRDKVIAAQIQSLFIQEMIQNGVLIAVSNNLSYAHKEPEMKRILGAYDATFRTIAQQIQDGTILTVKTDMAAPLRQTA